MKPTRFSALLPLAFGLTMAGAGIASAQAFTFAGIDLDADGALQRSELDAAFGANAELALDTYDVNGDGVIAMDEARMVTGGGADASAGLTAIDEGGATAMQGAAQAATDTTQNVLGLAGAALDGLAETEAEPEVGAGVEGEIGTEGEGADDTAF